MGNSTHDPLQQERKCTGISKDNGIPMGAEEMGKEFQEKYDNDPEFRKLWEDDIKKFEERKANFVPHHYPDGRVLYSSTADKPGTIIGGAQIAFMVLLLANLIAFDFIKGLFTKERK